MATSIRIYLITSLTLVMLLTACFGRNAAPTTTPEVPLPSAESTAAPAPTIIPTGEVTSPATTEVIPPTDEPTTVEPTTVEPTTVEPTTVEPTTVEPTTVTPTAELPAADWPPQIVYSQPTIGEALDLDQPITIRFDQAMDQDSVVAAFDSPIAGTFDWPQPDTVVFQPDIALTRAQTYTVRISDAARSINGRTLRSPLALEFQTAGFLELGQIVPTDGSTDIDTDASITLSFNRPVVPLLSTASQDDLLNPLTIEPSVEGEGRWIGTSIYRFQPEGLVAATTYRVTVNDGLTDVTGAPMEAAVSAEFSTLPPKLTTFRLSSGAPPIAPTDTISATFNTAMDRAATEAATNIEPAAALSFLWSDDNKSVRINSAEFILDTTYRLDISKNALSSSGIALDAAKAIQFSTLPYPAVDFENSYPADHTLLEKYAVQYFDPSIKFVSPMNWDTIEDKVSIEPQPERINYRIYNDRDLNLDFHLEYNQTYTITIPATAEDIFGNTLGEAVSLHFSTPAYPAYAGFNVPSGIAQFSSSFPTEIAVNQRNSAAATVRLERVVDGLPLHTLYEVEGGDFYYYEGFKYLGERETIREFTLEPTDQLRTTTLDLSDPTALPHGVYLLTIDLSSESERARSNNSWQRRKLLIIVADTNLVLKETPENLHVWATDLASGQPLAGQTVTFYANYKLQQSDEPIATAVTNEDGFASIDKGRGGWRSWDGNVIAVLGSAETSPFGLSTTDQNLSISPWQLSLPNDLRSEEPEIAFVYTERPLYRPGDTVYFRGWFRANDDARFTLSERDQAIITIRSPDYQDSRNEQFVEVDALGNFSGEFIIPDDASLGEWSLSINNDSKVNGRTHLNFTIAEFRKPEFTLAVEPFQAEGLRDETVKFTISAEYLSGGNAADLDVNWSAHARASTPSNYDNNFRYGCGGGYHVSYDTTYFGDFITSGNETLDENGQLIVEVPARLIALLDAGNITLSLEATATDETNNVISSSAEMVLYSAEIQIGIDRARNFYTSGNEATFNLRSIDTTGAIVPNQLVDLLIEERTWTSRRPEGAFEFGTVWELVETEVARFTTTTDAFGQATTSYLAEDDGSYVATATVTDAAGRIHESETIFYIYGGHSAWRFDPEDRKMTLTTNATDYAVGDTAEILVQNPFKVPTEAWLTIERGELIEQRRITLPAGGGNISLPLSADHAPNVFVGLTAVKPVDGSARPWADIRFGITELIVDPAPFALNIDISSAAAKYAPRGTVTYNIETTDAAGVPVSAEIGLALVDLAILTLKNDDTPPLLETFYKRVPLRSRLSAGLFNSAEGLATDIPDEPFGGGGGGGGADGVAALNFDLEREGDARSDFRDTAFWEAIVTTDDAGRATVSVTLPDNLTTWRMTARGVSTADTLVGETTHDILATKPLLIRPITPRFFTYGDRVALGASVNNNSDNDLEVTALLEAAGVTFEASAKQTVTIPANSVKVVRWPVLIEDVDVVDLTFRVSAGELSDVTKPTVTQGEPIPVVRHDAQDIVGTSGILHDESRQVEALLLPPLLDNQRGELNVTLSPSLAASIFDSLQARGKLNDPIYACPYGLALQLLPNVATANAINNLEFLDAANLPELDPLIRQQILRLQSKQKNGAWSWCSSTRTDPYTTAMALNALIEAAAAGYSIDSRVIASASRSVWAAADSLDPTRSITLADRKAYYLYTLSLIQRGELATSAAESDFSGLQADRINPLADSGLDMQVELDTILDQARGFLTPNALALLQMAYLNSGLEAPGSILSDLNNNVDLSASGAHWEGSYAWAYWNYGSDARTTATVIQALTQSDPDNPLLPNALRWLMSLREGPSWRSHADTAWALSAANSYMLATGENSAEFDYTLQVNGGLEADGTFTSENLLTSERLTLPTAALRTDDVNFLDFQKDGPGTLYYATWLNAFVSAESVAAVDRGFSVERHIYDANCEADCLPITRIEAGEEARVELTIIIPRSRYNVQISSPLPSGADAINPELDTTASDTIAGRLQATNNYRHWWGRWDFDQIEFRDEKVTIFANHLHAGTYTYSYNLQAMLPGDYQVMPTLAREVARPEVFGRSDGLLFTIE